MANGSRHLHYNIEYKLQFLLKTRYISHLLTYLLTDVELKCFHML